MNRLDGKIAVVTGGTQGLGAAIARQFAEAGAAGIVICGRNREKGEAVAASIAGTPVIFVPADLAETDDALAVIKAADGEFGRVDILVNAAGLTDRGTLIDTTPELFDRMFAINTRAPFFLMQGAVKVMIREGIEGAIVNIGSTSAMAGQPFIAPYCASKGGVEGLTQALAVSLGPEVRVNAIAPGWIVTEGWDDLRAVDHAQLYAKALRHSFLRRSRPRAPDRSM